jgi:integrase
MSRSTEDAPITLRAARERLPKRHEPYWRTIEGGLALGYRKGTRGGVWFARLWEAGRYRKTTLGRSDDTLSATHGRSDPALSAVDGRVVLDFRQAQAKAQEWAVRIHRVAAGLEPERAAAPAAPYTLASAVADYLADYAARGGKALATTRQAAEAHILPSLGDLPVGRLTRDKLKAWHRALAASPARLRAKQGQRRHRVTEGDSEAPRRRRSSANRVLTILKAALNHARAEGKVTCSPDAWASVKAFRGADKPKVRYLLADEIGRLVNACPLDFRQLVTAALLTGCRYGELAAMTANSFDPQSGIVTIGDSKSGKTRHVALTDEGRTFFSQASAGRPGSARLFERNGVVKQATRHAVAETARVGWSKSDQFRLMRAACDAAKISPAVSFHELRHTYGSRLAMRGVPMGVIAAQLGHSDTRMTERHYAHLSPSYVADTVRQSFGTLGIVAEAAMLTPLRRRATR